MNQYINPWTPDRIAYVTAQWNAGYSAGQIALVMHCTRSSVIGKIHRLGLGGRGQPNQRLPKGRKHVHRVTGPRQRAEYYARSYTPPREKYPLLPRPEALPEPVSLKLTIYQLTDHTCKYPGEEDGPPWSYCGHRAVEGKPYCGFHQQLTRAKGTQRDFDRIASRSMGGMSGLGKSVVAE